jgi:mono/diheme cytochrome c family protein
LIISKELKMAKRAVFGCLVLAMSICAWTIGSAAEDPGQKIYDASCKRCHAADGRGVNGKGPTLMPFEWSYEQVLDQVRHPFCEMPSFTESEISDAQVAQIVAYLKTLK